MELQRTTRTALHQRQTLSQTLRQAVAFMALPGAELATWLAAQGYQVLGVELSQFAPGSIIEVRPMKDSVADRQIAAQARDGIYRAADQRVQSDGPALPAGQSVAGILRRLEALRRARVVQRIEDGVWKIPPDLVVKGRAYDQRRTAGVEVLTRSVLSLADQVKASLLTSVNVPPTSTPRR